MSDLAYLSAYRILLEAENRKPGSGCWWEWQLKDGAVQLKWALEDRWKNQQLCSLQAEGHTFETAMIRLAAAFQKTPLAKELHLQTGPLEQTDYFTMVIMAEYDILLEELDNGKVGLSAYAEDDLVATAEGADLRRAEEELVKQLKIRTVRRLEDPERFKLQWRFLEKLSDLDWNSGSCLQTIANARENGEVDPIFTALNRYTQTFLCYDAMNPAYVPTRCSGTTFEAAVDAFARSFGWEG